VKERDLRNALARVSIPGEGEASERAWAVVRDAFEEREHVRWPVRRRGLVAALVAAGALLVATLTAPGQAVVDRFRDAVGRTPSEPALVRLPAPGRLLVLAEAGPWVVSGDGSKRLLGAYDQASWSPRGLYVAAAQGQHLVALDPESGDVRWSLTRAGAVRDPRWSGGGLDTRIAYRAGSALHVVAGDGTPDTVLATSVGPIAPAWKPNSHVLAYAGADGRAHVVDADSRVELWRTPRIAGIRKLLFSQGRLVVVTARKVWVYRPHARARFATVPPGHLLLDAAVLPFGRVVYADYDQGANETSLVSPTCATSGACLLTTDVEVFQGPARIEALTASPDGRWLAAAWPEADQFLFFRLLPRVGRVVAVSNVTREFDPGSAGSAAFPRLEGWAPAP
jgi:hypothetical protein